jgi:hypothetical protein
LIIRVIFKYTMRILLSIFLTVLFIQPLFAQKTVQMDSSYINVRTINPETISRYRSQKAFQYDRDKAKTASLWERMWNWFWDKYYELLGKEKGNFLIKALLWTFAILGLTYFLLKIIGMDALSFFGKKNRDMGLDYEVLDENVHTINFSEAIEKAETQKNFRLAVRLLYLQTLKKLTDKGFINWQVNKTNRQYIQELSGKPFSPLFNSLTGGFEYIWYGEFLLQQQEYELIRNQFIQLQQQIK